MNKNPDRTAKATLHAGKIPQTTDVILDVDTNFPIHLTGSYDKEGATSTGKHRKGFGLRHNNFLSLDDTLIGGYSYGEHFEAIHAYHSIPITSFGTSILYGYSYSKSFPRKEYETYGIDSRSKNTSVFVHQDFFKKEKYLGEVYLGVDANDKTVRVNTGLINKDRLRIARVGSNFVHRGMRDITFFNPEVSQGINGLGSLKKNSLSSRGAKSTFSKFNLGVKHKRSMPLGMQTNVNFKGQAAFSKLPTQEEFNLGGIKSVRGYPSGDYMADNSVLMNLELQSKLFFIPDKIKIPFVENPLMDNPTVLLFYDHGWGKKRGDNPLEKRTANLRSVGSGIRIRFFNKALLRLEWGFPVGDDTTTEKNDSRFHMSLDF